MTYCILCLISLHPHPLFFLNQNRYCSKCKMYDPINLYEVELRKWHVCKLYTATGSRHPSTYTHTCSGLYPSCRRKISSGFNLEKWHFTFNLLNIYWKTVKLHESTVALQWECMQHIIFKSYQTPTLKKSTGSPEYAKTKEVIKLSSTVDNWEQVLLIPHHPDNVISNIFTFWSEIWTLPLAVLT